MKKLLSICLIALAGVASAPVSAQEPLPAPTTAPKYQEIPAQPDEIAPLPLRAYPPSIQSYPAQSYPAQSYPMPSYPAAGAPVLFTDVKVRDPRKIHPYAVPTIVEVPDPRDPCCRVCVEICAPPCELQCVKPHGLLKRQTRFDYGEYKVDVIPRFGRLVIDYDA
jgi:hypothetical protein